MNRLKSILRLLRDAAFKWNEDNAWQLSGALAYYAIFSLAPLLLIVVAIVNFIWGDQALGARMHLLNEIQILMGAEAANITAEMLDNITAPGSGDVLATVLGAAGLLFGATAVFAQLQYSLNAIWSVRADPERGFKNLVMTRVLSFGMILIIGFLLLISLILSAGIAAVEEAIVAYAPGTRELMGAVHYLLSLGIITLLFAAIYRFLPDVDIAWRDVWTGAVFTSLLFVIGKVALGVYIGNSDITESYGAAGSLAVLLIWVYYSSLIFFLGAEITQIYASRYGSHINPSTHAVEVREILEPVDEFEAREAELRGHEGEAPAHGERTWWRTAAPVVAAFALGRWLGRR